MEINTTYPNQNTLASQGASRDQKTNGVEELAERRKPSSPANQPEKTEPGASDTLSLSAESLKLSQTAGVQNNDNQVRISSRDEAQQAVGKLISDIQGNPDQAQYAIANRARANLGTLLN